MHFVSGCLYVMFLCQIKPRVLVNQSKQCLSLLSHGKWVTSKKLLCFFCTRAACVSICLFPSNFQILVSKLNSGRSPESTRGSFQLQNLPLAPVSPRVPSLSNHTAVSDHRASSQSSLPSSLPDNLPLLDTKRITLYSFPSCHASPPHPPWR